MEKKYKEFKNFKEAEESLCRGELKVNEPFIVGNKVFAFFPHVKFIEYKR